MDPHQAEDNSNDGGSAGTDIKLNLDISLKVLQVAAPVLASTGGVGGLFKKYLSTTWTVSLYSSQGRCFLLYHFRLSTVHTASGPA